MIRKGAVRSESISFQTTISVWLFCNFVYPRARKKCKPLKPLLKGGERVGGHMHDRQRCSKK